MVDYIGNNPKVDVDNEIPGPDINKVIKKYYEYIDFFDKNYDIYNPTTFNIPANMTYYFHKISEVINEHDKTMPFVSNDSWENNIKDAPSGFINSANSLMPKIVIPSQLLVDNGINVNSEGYYSEIYDGPSDFHGQIGFNWNISKLAGNADTPTTTEIKESCEIGDRTYGKKYVSLNSKADDNNEIDSIVELESHEISSGGKNIWSPANLVSDGAYCFVFNVTPVNSNQVTTSEAGKKWNFTISMGSSIDIDINDTGSATIRFENGQLSRAQLVDAKSKEKPPQAEVMKNAYVLVIYPVWNGIVVACGIQDIQNNIKISSQYCIAYKDVNLLNATKIPHDFETEEPSPVMIGDYEPLMSSPLTITTNNCKLQFAYVPIFFLPKMVIDTYFVGQKSDDDVKYIYNAYPIWTKNGTQYTLNGAEGGSTGIVAEDAHIIDPNLPIDVMWYKLSFIFENPILTGVSSDGKCSRRAPEIFGYILETTETKTPDIRNSNGSFNIGVSKTDVPAGPIPSLFNWKEYIKSVSLTIGLGETTGQITVDKYGLVGQNAFPKQSIGALTLSIKGPGTNNTYKSIFSGIASGIADNRSVEGADWTIQLNGLEKKLQDIVLINVPFFDGYKIISNDTTSVLGYLCSYGGIAWDWEDIGSNERLPSSTEISAPIVDFKTGTNVYDAINQVMELTACSYTITDEKIHFYKLGNDGLPITLGPNRALNYPNTKIITVDRTPDFEDLRNEILVMGLQEIPVDNQSNPNLPIPILPLIKLYDQYNDIDPTIPWSKPMVYGVPGYVNEGKLDEIYEQVKKVTRKYELTGRTTIPGNADIRPYDQWNVDSNEKYVIMTVTHNIDLVGKTWTTDLEFFTGKL